MRFRYVVSVTAAISAVVCGCSSASNTGQASGSSGGAAGSSAAGGSSSSAGTSGSSGTGTAGTAATGGAAGSGGAVAGAGGVSAGGAALGGAGGAGGALGGAGGAAGAGGDSGGSSGSGFVVPGEVVLGATADGYVVIGRDQEIDVVPFSGGTSVKAISTAGAGYFSIDANVVQFLRTPPPGGYLDSWTAATGLVHVSSAAGELGVVSADGTQISWHEFGTASRSNFDGTSRVKWTNSCGFDGFHPINMNFFGGHWVLECSGSVLAMDQTSSTPATVCKSCVSWWPHGAGNRVLVTDDEVGHNPRLISFDTTEIDMLPPAVPNPAVVLTKSVGVVYVATDGSANIWRKGDAAPTMLAPPDFTNPYRVTLSPEEDWVYFLGTASSVFADVTASPPSVRTIPGIILSLTSDTTQIVYTDSSGALAAMPRSGGSSHPIGDVVASVAIPLDGTRMVAAGDSMIWLVDAAENGPPPVVVATDWQGMTKNWTDGTIALSKDKSRIAFGASDGVHVVVLP